MNGEINENKPKPKGGMGKPRRKPKMYLYPLIKQQREQILSSQTLNWQR
jgi:hypothetical protein